MKPRILRADAAGSFVILCDHASNRVPPELNHLGLCDAELRRHIAWDIGAAGVAAALSEMLDSPAVFSPASRLVVDCNRHPDATDLMPAVSDGTLVPGNQAVTATARADRLALWFQPYHEAAEELFLEREARGLGTVSLSVHSMTDRMDGVARPWQISLSSCSGERRLTDAVLASLRRESDLVVGDNEPYDLDPAIDYSTPFHALRRGLPYVQVEFRQDLIGDESGQREWAERFARALK